MDRIGNLLAAKVGQDGKIIVWPLLSNRMHLAGSSLPCSAQPGMEVQSLAVYAKGKGGIVALEIAVEYPTKSGTAHHFHSYFFEVVQHEDGGYRIVTDIPWHPPASRIGQITGQHLIVQIADQVFSSDRCYSNEPEPNYHYKQDRNRLCAYLYGDITVKDLTGDEKLMDYDTALNLVAELERQVQIDKAEIANLKTKADGIDAELLRWRKVLENTERRLEKARHERNENQQALDGALENVASLRQQLDDKARELVAAMTELDKMDEYQHWFEILVRAVDNIMTVVKRWKILRFSKKFRTAYDRIQVVLTEGKEKFGAK